MHRLFFNCQSLTSLPNISKWNIKNIKDMSYLFGGCESSISIPDMSKWDIRNVKYKRYMFRYSHSLMSLPNICSMDFDDYFKAYSDDSNFINCINEK